jgi:DNA-binding CsgD family transcriptional regulator
MGAGGREARAVAAQQVSASVLPGRARDLDVLEGALADARGGRPRVVVVEGEPGMGKTALLDAVLSGRTECPGCVRVTCDRFEEDVAYAVTGMLLAEPPDPMVAPAIVGRQLIAWFGSLQQDTDIGLLAVDDVQWMDRPSVDALRFALRRLRADRFLAILARRPADLDDPWASLLSDTGSVRRQRLRALTAADVTALARAERGWVLPAATAERLVRHTGGSPLLVKAFLHELSQEQLGPSSADLPVPATAAAAVQRMLQDLDDQAVQLVQALAVLAEATARVPLGAVAGLAEVSTGLTAALRAGAIVEEVANGTVGFAHGLYRDAVYESIPAAMRRLLHERAVEWTTGQRRLAHRVAATDRPDGDLAATLIAAAEAEAGAGRSALAASYLLQARTVATTAADRDRLLISALHRRIEARDLTGAERLRQAAEASPPNAARSLALGLLDRESGQIEQARILLTEAVSLAVAAGDGESAAQASLELGALHASLNEGEAAAAACARAFRSSRPPVMAQAKVLHAIGSWEAGRISEALAELDAADDARAVEPAEYAAARGMIRYFAGDLRAAREDLGQSMALAHTWRLSVILDRVHIQRSLVHFTLGDWDAAAVDASGALALGESGDHPWLMPLAHAVSIHVPAARGQWDAADHHLTQARLWHERIPTAQAGGYLAMGAALLAATREDFEAAVRILQPMCSGPGFSRLAAVRGYRSGMAGLVQALVRTGRLAEAADGLRRYESLLDALPGGPWPARLGWLRGMLAEAHGEPLAAQAAYAADLADQQYQDTPFPRAQLLLSSGRLERALGHRREAIDQLRAAREIFLQLRATPYIERCDEELSAAGLQPLKQDPLALTPREQDVATLVARGLTNNETAAQLFLTPKTIEYHLRNIFAKLAITSRRELRQLLPA